MPRYYLVDFRFWHIRQFSCFQLDLVKLGEVVDGLLRALDADHLMTLFPKPDQIVFELFIR